MSSLDKGLLDIVIPKEDDFVRMIDQECRGIVVKSYKDFVEWNLDCLKKSTEEDLKFFRLMCNRIMRKEISQMDFEDCIVWITDFLYFDYKRNLVLAHSR